MRTNLSHWILRGSIALILAAPTSLFSFSPDQLRLKAGSVDFDEDRHILRASSNVELSLGETKIQAPALKIDTKRHWLYGSGGVVITRGDHSAYAKIASYNINTGVAELWDVRVSIRPQDVQETVYLSSKHLIDDGHHYTGEKGVITSCSLPEPHYYFKASTFDYRPDHRIMGKNVFLYYPLGFVPFGLYSPIYTFELGKRRIIWNFPTIGEKKTPGWGWFVQNVVDYDYRNGHESSVLLDWYQSKGIGVGVRHYYQLGPHDGTAYYYQLEEQDTGRLNESLQLDHRYQLNDDWLLSGYYRSTNAERINSSGRIYLDSQGLKATYDHSGRYFDVGIDQGENFIQRLKSMSLQSTHRFNQDPIYTFRHFQSDNLVVQARTFDTQFSHYLKLPSEQAMTTTLKYQGREGILSNPQRMDNQLQATTVFSKIISPQWKAALTVDHLFDLDSNRVTGDFRNFFYKLPELKVTYTPLSINGYTLTSALTVARYQEHRIVGSNLSKFPSDSEFEGQPNTYIFKQTLYKQWTPFSDKTIFSLNSTFDQFLFKTPEFSLLESDSFYQFNIKPSYEYKASRFIQLKTDYNRTYIPKNGNSPFISQFKNGVVDINQLTQSIVFFYDSPDRYSWTHSVGYDYIRDYYTPYSTSILVKPNSAASFRLTTGADINHFQDYLKDRNNEVASFQNAGIFRAFIWDVAYTPSKNMGISVHHSQNVNKGTINNSSFTVSLPFGHHPDYAWAFESDFVYETPDHTRSFVFESYHMQTLGISKQNHCRKIKFSYNKLRDEYRLLFTILAFPKDSFGFKKDQNVTTFEGFFDKPSQERF
jgi:hypothetical protein